MPALVAALGSPVLVYFHGAPGGVQELAWLEREAAALGLTCFAVDRFVLSPKLQGDAYFQALAASIQSKLHGRPCWFVGFSIGSFVALQTARWMQGQVQCWSPLSMAYSLTDALPRAQPVHVLPGLSHYSCLFQALPQICQELANAPQA